jgi:hypothetical protein
VAVPTLRRATYHLHHPSAFSSIESTRALCKEALSYSRLPGNFQRIGAIVKEPSVKAGRRDVRSEEHGKTALLQSVRLRGLSCQRHQNAGSIIPAALVARYGGDSRLTFFPVQNPYALLGKLRSEAIRF